MKKIYNISSNWIIGFVDGDGHFGISTNKFNQVRYRFVVSQNISSIETLYKLQNFFNCGFVHKAGKNMAEYYVGKQSDLINIILPFFQKIL